MASITHLYLVGQNIQSLQPGDFSGLSDLQLLDLSENQLSTLPTSVFSNLDDMQTLYLSGNELNTLTPGIFSGLSNLQLLDLSENRLSTLSPDVFSGLGNLRLLDLAENQLNSTLSPRLFSSLDNLQNLYLFHNQLSTLPPDVFSDLGNLQKLALDENRLADLPSRIFQGLSELNILWLDDGLLGALAPNVLPKGVTLNPTAPLNICDRTEQIRNAIVDILVGEEDASGESCREIPGESIKSIYFMDLSGQNIQSLQPGDFSDLNGLEELWLSFNQLSSLPAGVFSGLESLRVLLLNNNQFNTLASDVFSGLSNLQTLGLGNNSINALPSGVFSSLGNLQVLDLTGNQLNTLTLGAFSGLSNLDMLLLFNNRLGTLVENTFSGLNNLKKLSLAGNQLTTLPAGTFSGLSNLQRLWLFDNQLNTLPQSVFSNLNSLQTLDLNGNRLDLASLTQSFVESLGDLRINICDRTEQIRDAIVFLTGSASCKHVSISRMKFIYVMYLVGLEQPGDFAPGLVSKIRSLQPGDFAGLDNLQDMALFFHQISRLSPNTFQGLDNLRALGLDYNQLETLMPGAFSGLSNLRILGLANNQLGMLASGVFSSLGNLQILWMRQNLLSTLVPDVFSDLGNLQELYLYGNQLSSLPPGILSSLGNLQRLSLSNNQLTMLPPNVFSSLSNLQILWLSDNQLGSLPQGTFYGLDNLKTLNLADNPGAPFIFATAQFERVNTGNSLMPGFAQVKLVTDQTAISTITADLSIESGTSLTNELIIPKGSIESEVFTVEQGADAQPVRVDITHSDLAGYSGVEIASNAPLVLYEKIPSVSGVAFLSSPPDGAYLSVDRETITIAVSFDDDVLVTTTVSGPALILEIGEVTRTASYDAELSSMSTLIFSYELTPNDYDEDGISIRTNAITLESASIVDFSKAGNSIVLTLEGHDILNAAGHRVVGREFTFLFEPPMVQLKTGESTEVTLILSGAQMLAMNERVNVDLTPTIGLELLTPTMVEMNAQESSKVTLEVRILDVPGRISESLTAEASLTNARLADEILRVREILEAIRLRIKVFLEAAME